jgi:acetylornithine deacetylase/succinyl-diaminopimelate desuccinylase-like protein
MLEAGHAENALPQTARATVNCRVLPGEPTEEVHQTLVRVLADEQISVTPVTKAIISAPSPLDPQLMRPIEKLVASPSLVMVSGSRAANGWAKAATSPEFDWRTRWRISRVAH